MQGGCAKLFSLSFLGSCLKGLERTFLFDGGAELVYSLLNVGYLFVDRVWSWRFGLALG